MNTRPKEHQRTGTYTASDQFVAEVRNRAPPRNFPAAARMRQKRKGPERQSGARLAMMPTRKDGQSCVILHPAGAGRF
jgi:hypothetical protein